MDKRFYGLKLGVGLKHSRPLELAAKVRTPYLFDFSQQTELIERNKSRLLRSMWL